MTRDDVIAIFGSKISGSGEDQVVKLPDGSYVPLDIFAAVLVRNVGGGTTYSDLVAATQHAGYKPFFDQCKAEGLIS